MQTPISRDANHPEFITTRHQESNRAMTEDIEGSSGDCPGPIGAISELGAAACRTDHQGESCGKPPGIPDVEIGQRVLYIGAGADADCRALAERVGPAGFVVSLAATQNICNESCGNLTLMRVSPSASLPFKDNSMDWVVSHRPIDVAVASEPGLREFIRILRPGGRISMPATLARTDFGSLWSPRLEAIKVHDPSVAKNIAIEPAQEKDAPHIQALLRRENLPTDIQPHLSYYVVARHLGQIVGCSGMEVHGVYAVLRSLTVDPAYRRSNLSQRLLAARNQIALQQGVTRGYMLTTTVAPIVEAWGYRSIDRSQVPQAILETSEFRGDRCASATVLYWDFANCLSKEA